MAGSYDHIINEKGEFIGTSLIDNVGDAYEALEECYGMIQWLTKGNKRAIEDAQSNYKEALAIGGTGDLEDEDDD